MPMTIATFIKMLEQYDPLMDITGIHWDQYGDMPNVITVRQVPEAQTISITIMKWKGTEAPLAE